MVSILSLAFIIIKYFLFPLQLYFILDNRCYPFNSPLALNIMYKIIRHPNSTIYTYARTSFILAFACIIPLASPSISPLLLTLQGVWFFSYTLFSGICHYWIFPSILNMLSFSHQLKLPFISHWILATTLSHNSWMKSTFSVIIFSHNVIHSPTPLVNSTL